MEELEIIRGVLISIVAAAVLGYVMHRLRQPVIMGYIIAGIIIGPQLGLKWVTNPDAINFTSELGLIALMFMVGLELDLRKIKQSGKSLLIVAILQFAICVGLGLAFFRLGVFSEGGQYAALYLAIVFALSSTMIVVKVLYDKFELDTLPGRITLGILVLQDIWAIIFLTVQPNLADPAIGTLGLSLLKGIGLIAGSVLVSRYILPFAFRSIAKNPELILVAALGWCFLVSWISGDVLELSRAMGALIAGVSLFAFPYKQEINDRVSSIRSFFLILFFVSLGMRVTEPTLDIFLWSLLAALFLIASRFISTFPVLYLMKKGIRVSFLVPLNLSQISEFALVIVAIGITYGHVNESVMTIVLFTVMITFLVSTYMMTYSHKLYLLADRVLKKMKMKDVEIKEDEGAGGEEHRPILFLGFYKIASHLLQAVEKLNPAIKDKIEVIDFNPEVHRKLSRHGVKCDFGDLGNTGTLKECGIEEAKVVVSTIPDTILKGTSNLALLNFTKRVNPKARVVVTAESIEAAKKLWAAGADFVILPHFEAAEKTAALLEKLLTEEKIPDECSEYRCKVTEDEGEIIG